MGNYDISVFFLVFIKLFGNQDERTAQLIELNKDVFCQKKIKMCIGHVFSKENVFTNLLIITIMAWNLFQNLTN